MRTRKFAIEQIAHALRHVESRTAVAEVDRELGVTETAFYRWKRKFHGFGTPELRRRRQLCDGNRKLKQVVADLTLDRTVLQEALRRRIHEIASAGVSYGYRA